MDMIKSLDFLHAPAVQIVATVIRQVGDCQIEWCKTVQNSVNTAAIVSKSSARDKGLQIVE